jgi:hypothetical protein
MLEETITEAIKVELERQAATPPPTFRSTTNRVTE